ncbi:MAG TPA: hypothetical protein VJO13_15595 [Ktedonobacterales bacterium]|nr:hypothetical protein [Ktedonobacterales bacterium]
MMVYRFCVSSDAQSDDPYADFENSLNYAAYLRERDPEAAALLVDRMLPAMVESWYAERGEYPPARDQLLGHLAERAPDIAELVRQALRMPDVHARLRASQRLLARLRGELEAAVG